VSSSASRPKRLAGSGPSAQTLGGVSSSPFDSLPVPEHRAPRLNAQRASGTIATARLRCLTRCSPKTSLLLPRSPSPRHVQRHIAASLCVVAIPALPSLAVCERLRCRANSTPRTATAAATAVPLRCVAAVRQRLLPQLCVLVALAATRRLARPLARRTHWHEFSSRRLNSSGHRAGSSMSPRAAGTEAPPNPSLEGTSTGKALGPRSAVVYAAPRGPSAMPAPAPQLQR
jgi:hypothetical protein